MVLTSAGAFNKLQLMKVEHLQRSAWELIIGVGENELRVLFSMSVPVGLLFQGTYAVLRYEDRKFKTSNLHLGNWMKKRTLETAQSFCVADLEAMIDRLMLKAVTSALPPAVV